MAMTAVCVALIFWTFRLAGKKAMMEAFTMFCMFTQEVCLTMAIDLEWPQMLQDIWGWMSTLINFQVSFAGPECFGNWGYADHWTMKAVYLPLILMFLHGVMYVIRWVIAKGGAKQWVKYKLSGSGLFWYKLIMMTMLALCVEIWVCEQPTASVNASGIPAARLVADPGVTCDGEDGSPWPGLVFGSIAIFIIFIIFVPIGSFFILLTGETERDSETEWFQVSFGTLYMAFDKEHWWWHVGPITIRRFFLQIFDLSLKRSPEVMAGLSIAIHVMYGGCVALTKPYNNPTKSITDQSASAWKALDVLAVLQSVIQAIILILGLAANPSNADVITVTVLILYIIYAMACLYVFALQKEQNKRTTRAKASARAGMDDIQYGDIAAGLFDCCSSCCCKDTRASSAENRLQRETDVEMTANQLSRA
jgi:hypothetical protein